MARDRQPGDEDWEVFARDVGTKEERKLRARRERRLSPWFWAGMFGLVGWSVAVPTTLGILAGYYLDKVLGGPFSWTLMGLVVGVTLGCLNAWFWVRRESQRED